MSAESRTCLHEAQTRLLLAMNGGASVPPDFDEGRVASCALSLLRKRARAAARVWPALERSLGEAEFREQFLSFARQNPLTEGGGPLVDGYVFARSLDRMEEWSDEAQLEKLGVEMRYRWSRRGLIPRRGFALRMVKLKERKKLVIALRIPWMGMISFTM